MKNALALTLALYAGMAFPAEGKRRAAGHPSLPKEVQTTIIPAATAGTDVNISYHEQGSAKATTCFVTENNPVPINCRTDNIPSSHSIEFKDYAPGNGMIVVSSEYPLEIRSDSNDGWPLITEVGYLPSMLGNVNNNETLLLYTGPDGAVAKLTVTQRHDLWPGTNDPIFAPKVKEISLPPYTIKSTNLKDLLKTSDLVENMQIQIDVQAGKLGAATGIMHDNTTSYLPALAPARAEIAFFIPHVEQHDTDFIGKNLSASRMNSILWKYHVHGMNESANQGHLSIMPNRINTTRDIVTQVKGTGAGSAIIQSPPSQELEPNPLIGWSKTDNIYIPFLLKEESAKASTRQSIDQFEAIISNIDNTPQQRTTLYLQNPRSASGTGNIILTDAQGQELERIPVQVPFGASMEIPIDSMREIENGRVKLQLNHDPLMTPISHRVNLISITEDRATGKKTAAHVAHIREY